MKAEAKYKKNYNIRLRKLTLVLNLIGYIYFRFERKNPNDHHHTLMPVAKGSYKKEELK